MSDHIPFVIQSVIIKTLPIKSLIQFRSVSKQWKSFIDSSKFITDYHRTHHHHHLLVSYTNPENTSERKHVSILDDEKTFPQQKISLTVPVSVNQLKKPKIIGSSQGLVCIYDYNARPDDSGTKTAVIWNPVIRKSVTISVPILSLPNCTVLGFGVTPDTCDLKLVKISFDTSFGEYGDYDTLVEVFTLSTNAWKILTMNLPLNSTSFRGTSVSIDRFIYWCASDLRFEDHYYRGLEQIMSFDMITEEFKELDLPDSFARYCNLSISKVRESLVVVQIRGFEEDQVVSVWMMEHGDPKSLTKKFTINGIHEFDEVCGFRKSGEPLIEMKEDDVEREHVGLFVYEPVSGHMNSIGITAKKFSCKVSSCIETLLLLDH